ncbi:MAG TPA: MBL fold metallo-hydrolase [Propionicimonas sp.]|nr:MBL fold metallo-hydrolase [Propionicimonas sp.]HQA78258.1 MBL fold metallo-hydrolase [Propionicimonas sp.]HQD97603.1 MBL fold metallo-hydrolase [Propionicimonas sp.]
MLLGTGAADGIPNPFCDCQTCADYRRRGELRTPTSVLIDGRLLIDPGPEATRQVSRFGRDLIGLAAILAGHAHHDHLDPALLLHRSWVTDAPLTVAGPAPVVAAARDWVHPESAIEFRTLCAGDTIELAGYLVTALSAHHEAFGEALCYLVSDGRSTLLYATDTGLLPEATRAALSGRSVDLVLLEETFGERADKGDQHLDLATFVETVGALRDLGVVTSSTRVVAVHLGHDNPPLAELHDRLAAGGAEALPDGTLLQV